MVRQHLDLSFMARFVEREENEGIREKLNLIVFSLL